MLQRYRDENLPIDIERGWGLTSDGLCQQIQIQGQK